MLCRAVRPLQHAYMRPLGVISMLISVDEERGPSLFKVGTQFLSLFYKNIIFLSALKDRRASIQGGRRQQRQQQCAWVLSSSTHSPPWVCLRQ